MAEQRVAAAEHKLTVKGEIRVQLVITAYERNPRICVWIAGQTEPPQIYPLDSAHARQVTSKLCTKCSGAVWSVAINLSTVTVPPRYDCFVGVHLLVDQAVPVEYLHGGKPSRSIEKLLEPEKYTQTIGTAAFSVMAAMTPSPREAVPFFRTGSRGPPKGYVVFTCDPPAGPSLTTVKKMGEAAQHELYYNMATLTDWTLRTYKGAADIEYPNGPAMTIDHPLYSTPRHNTAMPPEMYYAPRIHPFPEAVYERLLSAALFATRTTAEETLKAIAAARSADTQATWALPCRVLGRMLAFMGTCMHYVPDILYRVGPVTWKGSDGVSLASLGNEITAENCDMYDDPLLTLAGDCEESARLVYWAAFYFGVSGGTFSNELLKELWKLRMLYVIGPTIVAVPCASGEEMSGSTRTGARAAVYGKLTNRFRKTRANGVNEGGGEDVIADDAHVAVLGIPAPRFVAMLTKGGGIKTLLPKQFSAVQYQNLPTLILEGTNIADPLQRDPHVNPTPAANMDWRNDIHEDRKLCKAVDAVEPLRAERVLAELRHRGDGECYFVTLVRFYSWDLPFFWQGERHTRFVFLDGNDRSGLPVQTMLNGTLPCALRSVGPMSKEIFDMALRVLDVYSPMTAIRLTEPKVWNRQLAHSTVPPVKPALLLCIKQHQMERLMPQFLYQLASSGLEVDSHFLSINEEMGCLYLIAWRKSVT